MSDAKGFTLGFCSRLTADQAAELSNLLRKTPDERRRLSLRSFLYDRFTHSTVEKLDLSAFGRFLGYYVPEEPEDEDPMSEKDEMSTKKVKIFELRPYIRGVDVSNYTPDQLLELIGSLRAEYEKLATNTSIFASHRRERLHTAYMHLEQMLDKLPPEE